MSSIDGTGGRDILQFRGMILKRIRLMNHVYTSPVMAHDDRTAEIFSSPPRTGHAALDMRGDLIGPYKVLSLLGEGGFGSVYLAEQTSPVQRRVALKIVKPGMDSRSVLARFEAERQALALMDHPSVAKVFDAGLTAQGRPYFAMELVRGEPITRFCEVERLGVDDRVALMIQVCSAVQHAHMKGVVHRDLKPSNILVEMVDRKPAVKVIDFGVAKALHQRLGESTVFTEQGQMIGTPEYVAPEQARGSVDVDTRADVYALGAILYELLTGVTPVDMKALRAGGFIGLQRAIDETHPPAPSQRLSGMMKAATVPSSLRTVDTPSHVKRVRGELDWIVMKCLEKERSRRYDSAAALADDLERYLRDEPVLAGPPSAAYRAAKFVRRHRFGVGAAAAVLLALIAGVIGTGYGLARALGEREVARQRAEEADRAREESEAVTAFLTQMLQSVQPDESGRDVTVREVLDQASESLATEFADRPEVEARLRQAVGISYWELGLLDDADKHLPAVVELRRKTHGPEHAQTHRAKVNVASLRLQQGRTREAEDMLREAVDGLTRAVGADHELTLGALSNLAVARTRRVIDDETLDLQRRVVEGQKRVQGPDHPHTLGAMLNLADLLVAMNRLDEAEPVLREAAASWERSHGPEKTGTLLAMHNLAMLELERGRVDEAERLMRRVVEARERVLGATHLETLGALANLGLILSRAGKRLEAESVYTTAWRDLRDTLGDDHPTTIIALGQLASMLAEAGWPERSRGVIEELTRSARSLAQNVEIRPSDFNDLAWLLLYVEPAELRDTPTALLLAARACDSERTLGGQNLWMYLDTLAVAQAQSGSPGAAMESQREALKLLPASGEMHRAEMEQRLREYEAAASGGGGG
jgi:non-specific serine/threonine protein kinase/serine/threonine-protein kinase